MADGYPCIGEPGVCIAGKCKDCDELIGVLQCPGITLCDWDMCVLPSCKDGLVSGTETATDCGGPTTPACRRCDVGQGCTSGSDCLSRVCKSGLCQQATHDDGQVNGYETGVDCGYPDGPLHMCKDGEGCSSRFDCRSDICYFGKCLAPTCTDDRQNGTEVGSDCGGDVCPPCPPDSK